MPDQAPAGTNPPCYCCFRFGEQARKREGPLPALEAERGSPCSKERPLLGFKTIIDFFMPVLSLCCDTNEPTA